MCLLHSVLCLDNDGCVQVVLTSGSSHRTAHYSSLTNATSSSSTPVGHISSSSSRAIPDAPPTTPASSAGRIHTAASQKGFFDGVFGCLRPVLSFIGKATAAELKHQGQFPFQRETHHKLTFIWLGQFAFIYVSLRFLKQDSF